MSRGLISSVPDVPFVSAFPVRGNVPGMFLDDALFLSLCAALDDLLAPAVAALDCFPAYLDPWLAPEDFLDWLAALVGSAAQRADIARAVASYGERGTAAGLRACAAAAAGVSIDAVTVDDPGGVSWSATPGGTADAPPVTARVRVTVAADADPAAVTIAVQEAIEASRPVHCPLTIEVGAS